MKKVHIEFKEFANWEGYIELPNDFDTSKIEEIGNWLGDDTVVEAIYKAQEDGSVSIRDYDGIELIDIE